MIACVVDSRRSSFVFLQLEGKDDGNFGKLNSDGRSEVEGRDHGLREQEIVGNFRFGVVLSGVGWDLKGHSVEQRDEGWEEEVA